MSLFYTSVGMTFLCTVVKRGSVKSAALHFKPGFFNDFVMIITVKGPYMSDSMYNYVMTVIALNRSAPEEKACRD